MGNRRIRALIAGQGRIVFLTMAGFCLATTAAAQDTANTNLSQLLPDLILREIVLPTPTAVGLSHSAHFSPFVGNDLNNPAVGIVESFNKLMIVQLSTFPLGSSAGGFTYSFDPALGTFRRGSNSFGPSFAERAATIGRRRLSTGFNYQHTSYDRFEGSDLENGSIKFYLRHADCCTVGGDPVPPFFGVIQQPNGTNLSPFFEGDLIEAALSLKVKTDTFAMFGNYGLTDRWDVGLAVPIVHVNLDASVLATIQRIATASNPLIHTFEAGNPSATSRTFSRAGSATGIGDVLLRTKYRLFDMGGGGIAAALDVRLPTGDEDNLLGGGGQARMLFIVSTGQGRLAQHLNFGYTVSGSAGNAIPVISGGVPSDFPDEVSYAGGVEFAIEPRLTIVGDLLGRTLRKAGRLTLTDKAFQYELPGPVVTPPPTVVFQEFQPRPGNINLLFGTGGIKYNPAGNLLLTASVLFPLNDSGLRSRIATVVGFDFAF